MDQAKQHRTPRRHSQSSLQSLTCQVLDSSMCSAEGSWRASLLLATVTLGWGSLRMMLPAPRLNLRLLPTKAWEVERAERMQTNLAWQVADTLLGAVSPLLVAFGGRRRPRQVLRILALPHTRAGKCPLGWSSMPLPTAQLLLGTRRLPALSRLHRRPQVLQWVDCKETGTYEPNERSWTNRSQAANGHPDALLAALRVFCVKTLPATDAVAPRLDWQSTLMVGMKALAVRRLGHDMSVRGWAATLDPLAGISQEAFLGWSWKPSAAPQLQVFRDHVRFRPLQGRCDRHERTATDLPLGSGRGEGWSTVDTRHLTANGEGTQSKTTIRKTQEVSMPSSALAHSRGLVQDGALWEPTPQGLGSEWLLDQTGQTEIGKSNEEAYKFQKATSNGPGLMPTSTFSSCFQTHASFLRVDRALGLQLWGRLLVRGLVLVVLKMTKLCHHSQRHWMAETSWAAGAAVASSSSSPSSSSTPSSSSDERMAKGANELVETGIGSACNTWCEGDALSSGVSSGRVSSAGISSSLLSWAALEAAVSSTSSGSTWSSASTLGSKISDLGSTSMGVSASSGPIAFADDRARCSAMSAVAWISSAMSSVLGTNGCEEDSRAWPESAFSPARSNEGNAAGSDIARGDSALWAAVSIALSSSPRGMPRNEKRKAKCEQMQSNSNDASQNYCTNECKDPGWKQKNPTADNHSSEWHSQRNRGKPNRHPKRQRENPKGKHKQTKGDPKQNQRFSPRS